MKSAGNVAWNCGGKTFSPTSALEEEPNLQTPALKKSPFIREKRHGMLPVPLCQTHENTPLGQTGWIHATGEVEWMLTWTIILILDKMAKVQEVPNMNW